MPVLRGTRMLDGDRSKRVHAPLAAVVGIADQTLSLGVDDPVERCRSYPQEQLAPIHPEQDQPEDQEHGRAVEQRLVRLAEDRERVLPQVDGQVPRDEALPEAGHAIGGDRVHADDPERKGPEAHAEEVEHGVEARQKQEAPAAAEEHPARGPDPLDDRADAQLAQAPAGRQADGARRAKPETLAQPGPGRRKTPPARRPRIIVASVGMKLKVA